MKTKKELRGSQGTSFESWRTLEKGASLPALKNQKSPELRFRIAGYIRLSPTNDEREEGSLVSHPQRIKQFVDLKNVQSAGGWGEIVEWYVDKDLSGKDTNRPSLHRMLSDIQSGKVNSVIVTELSRLSRNVKDFCEIKDFFKEHRVAFFSLKENFDTSTPSGELMLMQSIAFAQFERQTIVDRIKKGARARAERGLANGCITLGFKSVEHKPNYRDVDEKEKPYVEMIFRKILELKKLSPVLDYLNENGYRTKEYVSKDGKKVGGNRWTISSLHSTVTNRAYIGEREVNKKNRGLNQAELVEEDRYFFVDAHWPAIIDRKLFFSVQALLEQNKKKARKYTHDYRLTGLLTCSECGAPMIGKSGTGRKGKYFYYGHMRKMVASSDRHIHRCHVETIPALDLEEAIVARLRELAHDKTLVARLVKESANSSQGRLEHERSLLAAKEQERRKVQLKLDNLLEAISEETDKGLRAALSEKAKDFHAQLEQVESALFTLKTESSRASSNVIDLNIAFGMLKAFREGFDKQPISIQAEILKDVVRRIVVHSDKIVAEFYGAKPVQISLAGDGLLDKQKYEPASAALRSPVRTVFKLVEAVGVEPTSGKLTTRTSTCVSFGFV